MFSSVTHYNDAVPRTAGDIVETEQGVNCRITQPLRPQTLIYEHPKAVVFLLRSIPKSISNQRECVWFSVFRVFRGVCVFNVCLVCV
jgi:hypothetical protein